MLVLATLLAAVVGAATVKEGVSAHASRPSSGSIPPVKNRKPPVQLPEDILYLVLEQLSGSLVFGEAHTALSACELVSHTFHSLVQRHKDEHLVDASPEALEDLAMWPRLQSLSLVHLSSVSDRSVVRMNPPPSLTHLSLLTPSAVHSFTKLFVPYSTVLTSLSIAFPLLSPSPGPSGFSLVLTPLLLLLIKLEKLDLHIFTSRSTYLGAKPLPLDKLLDVHLPNFLARSRSGRFLSSFRVTLAPYTPADTAVLERAWRNKRGALQSLVRFERVRAVDATPLGLGWYDQGE
ncbi:hypothetical protein JCM8097_000741 [Rhodosporidiobolus ruineniae]